MYKAIRNDADAHVLVVDRSREGARVPLFYPDLVAEAPATRQMTLSLRELLVEKAGDPSWHGLVDDLA